MIEMHQTCYVNSALWALVSRAIFVEEPVFFCDERWLFFVRGILPGKEVL